MGYLFFGTKWLEVASLCLFGYVSEAVFFVTILTRFTFSAILVSCSEDLMELDVAEMKTFLQHLPNMDMDEVNCNSNQSGFKKCANLSILENSKYI